MKFLRRFSDGTSFLIFIHSKPIVRTVLFFQDKLLCYVEDDGSESASWYLECRFFYSCVYLDLTVSRALTLAGWSYSARIKRHSSRIE